jgi:hypothetical protein
MKYRIEILEGMKDVAGSMLVLPVPQATFSDPLLVSYCVEEWTEGREVSVRTEDVKDLATT